MLKKSTSTKNKPDLLLLIKVVHTTVLPNILRLFARQDIQATHVHTGHSQLKCTDVERLTKDV